MPGQRARKRSRWKLIPKKRRGGDGGTMRIRTWLCESAAKEKFILFYPALSSTTSTTMKVDLYRWYTKFKKDIEKMKLRKRKIKSWKINLNSYSGEMSPHDFRLRVEDLF